MTAPSPDIKERLRAAAEMLQRGDFERAGQMAAAILAEQPDDYDASQMRIMAALYSGRGAGAVADAQRLAAAYPQDPYAHNTLGAVLQVAGRMAEAAEAYAAATRLAPTWPDAWLNLGTVYGELGRHAEEIEALGKARSVAPNHPSSGAIRSKLVDARDRHAGDLIARGRLQEAAHIIAETQRSGLATAQTHLHAATALLQQGRAVEAIPFAREAARMSPASAEAAAIAGTTELEAGHADAAIAAFERAVSLDPASARWRFLQALVMPAILGSRAEGEAFFERATERLDALIAEPLALADPLHEVSRTTFSFAYAGVDDTALQRRAAQAYRLACPSLEWTRPGVGTADASRRRLRIGICSAHLRAHTIGKLNAGFVQHLDRRRFEVIVLRPPAAADTLSGMIDASADGVVTLPRDLQAAREAIAALSLDALFYPDIGMEPFTYFLAFARLAPLQFTTWGHPVTTGIPNVDAFISTRHAEPHDGARHYHEALVAFESLPSYYHAPRAPSPGDVRARLGFDAGTRLYACPQTLFKFHPDQDAALVEILRRDPAGRLLMVASGQPAWNDALRTRLARAGPDVAQRIAFVPPMPLPDFLAVVRDADAILDTFHFGGGNSSYESLSVGRPVVTWPGPFMRGRITAAWYDVLAEDRWVAHDADDYVERAHRLAHDREARDDSRRLLLERAPRLVGNMAVVRELEQFIDSRIGPARARFL